MSFVSLRRFPPTRGRHRAIAYATLLLAIGALAFAPSALAEPGASPSVAYQLVPGKQFSGDTSNHNPDANGNYNEFSEIALKAGDYVTVDWSEPLNAGNSLCLLAPGTNDNNWESQQCVASSDVNANGAAEFHVTITHSGTYFFQVWNDNDGAAYSLTVEIRRGVKPGDVPSSARAAQSGHTYHGDVSKHVPDSNGNYSEFWRVALHAGEHVTVSMSAPVNGGIAVDVLPVGTTNGNYANENVVTSMGNGSNGHNAVSFVAPRTGWYYLDFSSEEQSAYSFSVRGR